MIRNLVSTHFFSHILTVQLSHGTRIAACLTGKCPQASRVVINLPSPQDVIKFCKSLHKKTRNADKYPKSTSYLFQVFRLCSLSFCLLQPILHFSPHKLCASSRARFPWSCGSIPQKWCQQPDTIWSCSRHVWESETTATQNANNACFHKSDNLCVLRKTTRDARHSTDKFWLSDSYFQRASFSCAKGAWPAAVWKGWHSVW